ncbi:peptidylprolyl isomerase [Aeromicrobium sp.]|uniref:peptidylprolyl isomerase n=1 Tax=Aeromicrobium sp. TaxID=1871063 RepID=UPI0028A91A5F|nr:peptidylprolyl isomerase [Aeromicrobium sp.]
MRLTRLLLLALVVPALAACGGADDSDSSAAGACEYVKEGSAAKAAETPPADPKSAESLTIATNRGDIAVTLTPDATPCTVGNFVSLAEQGYFDGTKCHRLVPGFVLQCGDPAGNGTGGPGYRFEDELTGDEKYTAGTLAMANSGPDTNGSQFFIVLADSELPAAYTVFGEVDDAGLAVAREIEADGNAPDGVNPARDVVIESVS